MGQLEVAGAAAVRGPSTRSDRAVVCTTSGARPTAPFQVNGPPVLPDPGDAPLAAPSLVAGSPGLSGAELALGNGVLKVLGNSVPGCPRAMSASPESGPKENMKVCVPSAMVE